VLLNNNNFLLLKLKLKKTYMKKTQIILALSLLLSASVSAIDTWTQKADFGGAIRHWAACFSIGSKGYIGTGYGGGVYRQDVWEYDPALDVWTQVANFGGGTRYKATGFSIGSKGYICAGVTSSAVQKKDLWEYDPVANTWTAKTDFGGLAREEATAFVIGTKAYMGTGKAGTTYKVDMWEYDQSTNAWIQKLNYPFSLGTAAAVSFSIGGFGYLGTGHNTTSGNVYFYKYDPSVNSWSAVANISGGGFDGAIAFAIGGKGYVGIGRTASTYNPAFYEYDPIADGWTPKTNFAGGGRYQGVGFAIGSVGYVGTGIDGSAEYHDFYEWKNCSAAPATPSAITGSTTICTGTTNNYSVPAVSGATSYTWTLPGGWTGSSVTNSISTLAGSTSGSFVINVTANNPCGSSTQQSITVSVSVCTGIEDQKIENEFSIYPNPAANDVTLEVSEKIKNATIKIINNIGQVVFEEKMTGTGTAATKHIDISNYSKGVYTISIEGNETKAVKKLVVN
jgi:hypothetical protein